MLISEALKAAGCEGKVKIAMDCAASEFYSECCRVVPCSAVRVGLARCAGAVCCACKARGCCWCLLLRCSVCFSLPAK